MAKQAILDVLEKTIGKYVKNLDPESLNVAVWKGQIELQSLDLDLDAINTELARQAAESPNLAIPFRVIDGCFESFHVDVPWSRITSQSVVLRAKGLKVVLEPYDAASSHDYSVDTESSEKKRIQNIREQRVQSLNAADEYRQQANALRKLAEEEMQMLPYGSKKKETSEQKATFSENLVRRVIENIQIDVENVHVEIKESGSSAGVGLESFSLFTTDRNGKRMFVDRKNDLDKFLYKALQINGLGVYLDELSPFAKPLSTPEDDAVPQHSYILAPLSFNSKLRQAEGSKCVDHPKYLVLSELQKVSILLSKTQLELGNKIALAISPPENAARPLFPQYRPLTSVSKDNAREWWVYAYRCIGMLNGRRLWSEFLAAVHKRRTYTPLYKREAHHDSCSWIDPLTDEEKKQLDEIEQDRSISVEGIMAWRNLADAQVELEKRKREETKKEQASKGGIMASLFGSKDTAHSDQSARDDDPPITLSVEEMQELETITMKQTEDAQLSKDSKLCDLKFVLGAFKLNLMGHGLKQVAAFEMGTTTTTFKADADGSYVFESKLASMELHDKVTVKSLFPTVMRNITSVDEAGNVESEVFKFSLAKSRTGDQHMMLRLAAHEVVASQMLLTEVKHFFTLSGPPATLKDAQRNAVLRQSVSGSVDIFYDAEANYESVPVFDLTEGTHAATEKISDTLSSHLVDAWKSKTKEKKKWTVDCDIHAPVLIVPESCSSPEANVLVLDFGRLKFDYGTSDVGPNVKSWFDEQPRSSKEESVIDPGSLEIRDMTFTIGRAGDFHWRPAASSNASDIQAKLSRSTVIEPLSGYLNFGVLSVVNRDRPTVCAFGVVPVVGLTISPLQIFKTLSVYAGWKPVILEFIPRESDEKKASDQHGATGGVTILNEGTDEGSLPEMMESRPSLISQLSARRDSVSLSLRSDRSPRKPPKEEAVVDDKFAALHLSMALQRFSLRVLSQRGEGIEAHLVSVSASRSESSDGSAKSRLRMGWFWVLDRFNYSLPRKQRLLVHSTLPRSADRFAANGKYDIFNALRQQGVFDEDYSVSGELADITLKSKGSTAELEVERNPYSSTDPLGNVAAARSTVDAKFSSLFIHWNPQAIKVITQAFGGTASSLREFADKEARPSSPRRYPDAAIALGEGVLSTKRTESEQGRNTTLITAEMKSFEILLHSAKDDEPLFVFTMAETDVRLLSSQVEGNSSTLVSLGLGDVRVVSSELGTTHPAYRTLLGLAPDHSQSLLSVKYSMGTEAVEASGLESVDLGNCDMCGEVTLSPMRLVYIHAQVMTLVDYVTQGILGALTAQAASSASGAAGDMVHSSDGEKFFVVKATGFDVIVPTSATKTEQLTINAGDLVVEYTGFSGPGGGEANLTLADVVIADGHGQRMVTSPVRMVIDVDMPPPDTGSMDDRAMRIGINLYQVELIMSRPQYRIIMDIMAENVGENDHCLRSSSDEDQTDVRSMSIHDEGDETGTDVSSEAANDITHAGVTAVDVQNRLFIDFKLDVLSLELCGDDDSDPIVHFAALESHIGIKLHPDEESMFVETSLQDLTCDDRRLVSMDRPFRSLMSQDDPSGEKDIFSASYKKVGETSTAIDLKLGSPRIVLIPDLVSQVMAFFKIEKPEGYTKVPQVLDVQYQELPSDQSKMVEVHVGEHEESIETAFVSLVRGSALQQVGKMSFSVKTANCTFVLIDMGSSSMPVPESHASFVRKSRSQLVETLVFRGQFDAKTSLTSETQSKRLVAAKAELHGECMEAYTAHGSTFASPIQIMEPASVSAFFNLQPGDEDSKELDLRLVTLSPVDVTFSMQNAALLNAIAVSCTECFYVQDSDEQGNGTAVLLSEQEVSKIEALASALDTADDSSLAETSVQHRSVADQSSFSSRNEARLALSIITRVQVTMTETKLTLINDLQGLDEALFRINATNFVAGAQVNQCLDEESGVMKEITFQVQVNTSLMADYFDPSVQLWKVLLKRPWEVTLKGSREQGHRSSSDRMSTVLDVEACPCLVSFSEQFLVSVGAASRMWSIYSIATTEAIEGDKGRRASGIEIEHGVSKKALAATAARNLITSLPYAVENHSGLDIYFMLPASDERRSCPSGTMQYFRFEPPQGRGSGGHRRYGQDVTRLKALTLFVSGRQIDIEHIDAELSRPRHVHLLGEGQYLVSHASKEGKTKILHLSSPVDVHNCTSVSFVMSVAVDGTNREVGLCAGHQGDPTRLSSSNVTFDVADGNISKESRRFGIPLDLLSSGASSRTTFKLLPNIDGGALTGEVEIPSLQEAAEHAKNGDTSRRLDVTCRSSRRLSGKKDGVRLPDPLVLQVRLVSTLLDRNYVFIEVFLEPRILLENKTPVRLTLRTPMPHTFESKGRFQSGGTGRSEDHLVYHDLDQGATIEVFTPGPSIALSVKCTDSPVGGRATDWMEGGWVDVPLVREFGLAEPIRGVFPFVRRGINDTTNVRIVDGSEFFIVESGDDLSKFLLKEDATPVTSAKTGVYEENSIVELIEPKAPTRKIFFAVCNYAVDHTGDILFEMVGEDAPLGSSRRSVSAGSVLPSPFSAFAVGHRRVTLLPHKKAPLRLLHLTMEGDDGVRRSEPFLLDDVSTSEGGLDTTAISWEDSTESGYFAYKKLVDTYQFEVHVIPEFVLYNGSKEHRLLIKQQDGPGKVVDPGRIAPIKKSSKLGLFISIDFMDLEAKTVAMRVDILGLRVAVVKSRDGSPIGSVAVQTIIGNKDSRLVVKVGNIKLGSMLEAQDLAKNEAKGMFDSDVIRCRIRCSELQVTLNEARAMETDTDEQHNASAGFIEAGLNSYLEGQPTSPVKNSPRQKTWSEARTEQSEEQQEIERQTQLPVCTLVFKRFTLDWQRIFKDGQGATTSQRELLLSPERSQFSAIVHNVRILDETVGSEFPIVFDSSSSTSFFDLCVRFRGPLKTELVKVDLFDLNLAHAHGQCEKIVVQTTEDFIWKAIDVGNRIIVSTAELAGYDLKLEWDEQDGGYIVTMKDLSTPTLGDFETEGTYTPPRSETLYDISKARVSPFEMVVSFQRRPHATRYKKLENVRGAKLMNYFTQRMKFKVDRAELKFSRYEASSIKGPPDRLIELLLAVYTKRMKMKAVSMLTAVSFQDWKNLAARDDGQDDFKEGDILRATGNLAGGTAGYFAKKVGRGLGSGVANVTSALGNEIEEATGAVGARAVGAGINSVVSGLGGGVGDAIKGVGVGTGKVIEGAGKGVGQIFGGVTGGATMMAKGIGKGVTQGDGKAVVSGLAQGAASVGTGLGQGVEYAVMGAADGVITCGEGLASGVKSIGQGFATAFSGGKRRLGPPSQRGNQR